MFDGIEYEPYLVFCRKLNLQRRAEAGDWFLSLDLTNPEEASIVLCNSDGGGCGETFNDGSWAKIWLPRLDQWLVMLEEVNILGVIIERLGAVWFATDRESGSDREGLARRGSTREEAVARLYAAICWPEDH